MTLTVAYLRHIWSNENVPMLWTTALISYRFGRTAGVVALPDGCEALNDGCHAIEVLSANQSVSCRNETIDFDTLSKKLPHPDNAYA